MSLYKSTPTDPSLTLTNLTQLMENVNNMDFVQLSLNIPNDVYDDIYYQYSNYSKRKETLSEWYLNNHPAPSWQHIADGLYCWREHEALEMLRTLYLKGNTMILVYCSQLCGLDIINMYLSKFSF